MRARRMVGGALSVVIFGLPACGPDSAADPTASAEVVGGRRESGYRATGYLLKDGDDAPFCTATLVARDRVVTAAHCVDQADKPVTFGLGTLAEQKRTPVTAMLKHPGWSPEQAGRSQDWLHDVAVLTLASALDVAPIHVPPSIAAQGCGARYVGYGRTTEGPRDREDGYTGERKSTAICFDAATFGMLRVHGEGGGLCWGDSGGPLYAGDTITGVLHGHADRVAPTCEAGNRLLFTDLVAERDFLACALVDAVPLAKDTRCHWAEPFVRDAVTRGRFAPRPDGTLALDRPVTRLDFALLVARSLAPKARRSPVALLDRPSGEVGDAVDAVVSAGFFDAVPEVIGGRLRSASTMSRREVILGLAHGLALDPRNAPLAVDDAAEIPEADRALVAAAIGAGVVTSYPDARRVRFTTTSTRADAATMIVRAADGAKRVDHRWVVGE